LTVEDGSRDWLVRFAWIHLRRDRQGRREEDGLLPASVIAEENAMSLIHDATVGFGKAIRGIHAGPNKLVSRKLSLAALTRLDVASADFRDGEALPLSATADTADGAAIPPNLSWTAPPHGAQSMVVICEDPDAPFPEPFVHWLVYGLANGAASVFGSYRQGKNSKLEVGFTGAAPPPGHGIHHYHFQVFALDRTLALEDGSGRSALVSAMRDHVIAWGEIVGTYERR